MLLLLVLLVFDDDDNVDARGVRTTEMEFVGKSDMCDGYRTTGTVLYLYYGSRVWMEYWNKVWLE